MTGRIRNRKGFTIIEIMVVIALIGILAAVLVPQFGGVKDKARDAGMITNAKMVESYVAAVIDEWTAEDAVGAEAGKNDLIEAIENHFHKNGEELTNPYTGIQADGNIDVDEGTDYVKTGDAGVVYVRIKADKTNDVLEVYISGMDSDGNSLKNTERKVTR